MKNLILALCSAVLMGISSVSMAGPTHACTPIEEDNLRIIDKDTSVVVKTKNGDVTITRKMTNCAKNKGWLQPLVPAPGITPVTELEVIDAISNPNITLVDMRTVEWFVERTIPGSINIPYTEVAQRLDELGCVKSGDTMDCSNAQTVLGFCNGPVCPQSPTAMHAMIREGFPAEKIMYYRGGMLDWDALGLTTVEGEL